MPIAVQTGPGAGAAWSGPDGQDGFHSQSGGQSRTVQHGQGPVDTVTSPRGITDGGQRWRDATDALTTSSAMATTADKGSRSRRTTRVTRNVLRAETSAPTTSFDAVVALSTRTAV